MNIFDMKKSDFLKVRHRKWDEEIGAFDSLIIIPTRRKHDSGYMCMEFCAEKDGKPVALLSGCSDVIHIGRILSSFPKQGSERWRIDCLPCGYLRLFMNHKILCGKALSSFEVFSAPHLKCRKCGITADEKSIADMMGACPVCGGRYGFEEVER